MPAQLKLASSLRETTQRVQTLGAELSARRKAEFEAKRNAEKKEIDEKIRQAPIIAKQLIIGLPEFLDRVAGAGYGMAYVVYRFHCEPREHYFPNYESDHVPTSHTHRLNQYMIRRYMRGICQHVALWGLKQDFRVGLTCFMDSRGREIERMCRNHHGILPFYMPGMYSDYIPQTHSNDLLFFAW
jgi:hypothetical protein